MKFNQSVKFIYPLKFNLIDAFKETLSRLLVCCLPAIDLNVF